MVNFRFQLPHHKLSVIPSSPAYGIFISQLIRYARACSSYECFILRARRLSSKLRKQGYLVRRLKSSFRKFNGRYGDLIQQYEVSLSQMLNDILTLEQHGAFAMGVACQQDTLTVPDTWFRPTFWDLLVLQLLRPDSSNSPCLYATFHLEYPLVLSRFAPYERIWTFKTRGANYLKRSQVWQWKQCNHFSW